MTMTISKHESPDTTQESYELTFFEYTMLAIVTATPSCVENWISFIQREYNNHLHSLIIGLHIQKPPTQIPNRENPIATLHLCVGRHCLVFQIAHSTTIPRSLRYFLADYTNSFVGVGIKKDVEKLLEDWQLFVGNVKDLGQWAANEYGSKELVSARLEELTRKVMGKELISFAEDVTMSRWDNKVLTSAQVQFACVNAFLSFEIGKILIQKKIAAINAHSFSQMRLRND